MKGTSKVIMGATLVMVVILAVVISLILVLLAELYCSLLLRRRQLRNANSIPTATTQTTTTIPNASSPSLNNISHYPPQHPPPPPPFSSIYSQGVLQAPRSFLLPAVATKEDIEAVGPMKLHSLLHHQIVQIQNQESNASPPARHVEVLSSSSSSPPVPFISKAPPKPSQEDPLQGITSGGTPCCNGDEHLVYISNPIYENDEGKASGANTPFETPDTSPSRLERGGSYSSEEEEDEEADVHSPSYTPPLTPMKKLPAEACSVSLRDARSLDTSASDYSRSINGPSSSSSGSPRTSPSW